jgi:ATP-binding cassette subfamily F protein 3
LWLVADGSVKPFEGDMDDYARFVLERAKKAARAKAHEAPAVAAPVAPPAPPTPRATPAGPLKRKLEAAETTLARATARLEEIDAALADPVIYVRDPAKAAELGRKRESAEAAMQKAEAEWIAAAEALESAA